MEEKSNVNNLNGVENFGHGVEPIISEEKIEDEKVNEEEQEDVAGDGGKEEEVDDSERSE